MNKCKCKTRHDGRREVLEQCHEHKLESDALHAQWNADYRRTHHVIPMAHDDEKAIGS
jgi:hypothetical protein